MDRHRVIYLDGLERSGNVYLSTVIDKSMDDVQIKTVRTHDINTLKQYNRVNPFIVPVRDAFPSIVSSKVYRDYVHTNSIYNDIDSDNNNLDVIIPRYKEYVEYLIESPKFFIAPFHRFTEDHNETCKKIVKFHEDTSKLVITKSLTKEQMLAEILSDQKQSDWGDVWFHKELGNFPRSQSESKAEVEGILADKYSKDIEEIQRGINILYQRYYDIEI
jgi:hypothetical protein